MGTIKEEQNMAGIKNKEMMLTYFQIIDVWKRFCEEHSTLLDLTCEEYALLLDSKIEELEQVISEKDHVVQNIRTLEGIRQDLIGQINTKYSEFQVESVNDLLTVMREFEEKIGQSHLSRFNSLLIDIIEKIQLQNKKNQLFLNKAIHSLKEIRQEVMGEKQYSVYNQAGRTTAK